MCLYACVYLFVCKVIPKFLGSRIVMRVVSKDASSVTNSVSFKEASRGAIHYLRCLEEIYGVGFLHSTAVCESLERRI